VVVSINWGVEYTSTPSVSQREAARVLVEAGADLVIGNHPHVVQAVEYLDGALVAYALGNLVFDQSWSVETTEGVLLEASFAGGSLIGYRLRPLVITGVEESAAALYRPGLVGPPRSERILGRLWTATDALPPR
jgi:poly-gamma-glutamate synthesis protein (capsule biosynthesis protein)